MARATVAIFFFALTVAAASAAQAPAESPKTSAASAPANAPEVAEKAASASASRKSGPAAAPASKSSQAVFSSPGARASASAGEVSSQPTPMAVVSPIADGPAEGRGPADADNSGAAATLVDDAAIAIAAGVVVTLIFA